MKKLLVATTALVATAGMAAADVNLSGSARFGIQHNSGAVGVAKTRLEKRFTLTIDGVTESDMGLRAGARVRIRSDENAGTAVSGARVFVSGGGLTVAAGNILGALESVPGLYNPSVGLTGLHWAGLVTNTNAKGRFTWDAFSSTGNGAEGLEAIYSAAGFTVHVSHSSADLSGVPGAERQNAIHVAYNWEGWTFAAAYLDSSINTNDKWYLGVIGNIGDFGVGLTYADNDGVGKVAVNGNYRIGDLTISGYVADEDSAGARTSYGLGALYSLGGGINLVGGAERSFNGNTYADFGVRISF